MALADPEDKTPLVGVGYSIYQPISSFFDMSIGQGVGKQFSANKARNTCSNNATRRIRSAKP